MIEPQYQQGGFLSEAFRPPQERLRSLLHPHVEVALGCQVLGIRAFSEVGYVRLPVDNLRYSGNFSKIDGDHLSRSRQRQHSTHRYTQRQGCTRISRRPSMSLARGAHQWCIRQL